MRNCSGKSEMFAACVKQRDFLGASRFDDDSL